MKSSRIVVDVRTKEEFVMGHAEGSINIPMDEVVDRIEEFRAMENPILCCVSGTRSGQVVQYLKTNGIECENGGCWEDYC